MFRTLLAIMVLSEIARADVISEQQASCLRHEAGDSCQQGVCVPRTCSQINYTSHGPDGTRSYPCLICEAGAPSSSTSTSLIAGIALGTVAVGAGVWLAFRRRRQAPAVD